MTSPTYTHADRSLLVALESLAISAPAHLRAAHLAPRVRDLAQRIARELPREGRRW